jgi:steroid delta-isomerase-like uncharacterized protein
MSHTESRRTLIQRVWAQAWNLGEVDALDELHGDGYLRRSGESQPQSLDAFKASILTTRSAFPDLITTVDEIVLEGDSAAIRWHSTGTHKGALMGVPATNRRVRVSGATFALFDGDRIAEEIVTWDPRALLSALGIISVGQD